MTKEAMTGVDSLVSQRPRKVFLSFIIVANGLKWIAKDDHEVTIHFF